MAPILYREPAATHGIADLHMGIPDAWYAISPPVVPSMLISMRASLARPEEPTFKMGGEAYEETVLAWAILNYGLGNREDVEKGFLSVRCVSYPEGLKRRHSGLRSRT